MIKFRRSRAERYANPAQWTDFNSFIRRNRRRFLSQQRPLAIWFTGLSGSGKTTLSDSLNSIILRKGYFTKVFDGDVIRTGLCSDLGFSEDDRRENIRRTAEVARMFMDSGLIVLCSFISPTHEIRELARRIVGPDRFVEVYVNCPIEVCELRDVKGLYKKYRLGLLKNMTGFDSPYEAPLNPDIEIRTDLWDVNKCSRYLFRQVIKHVKYRKKK
ncbi:MAG TPA: adenylyl-sulfate kinase [Bacteroidales bacterium]|nr:adenylyl-sulfate kinase [Bacteroidales bacterium]